MNHFRLMIWNRQTKKVLGDVFLRPDQQIRVGKNPENTLALDHPNLSPFHLIFLAHEKYCSLTHIPGAPKLRYANPLLNLMERNNKIETKTIFSKGAQFRFQDLGISILGPDSIQKNPCASNIEKRKFPPKKLHLKPLKISWGNSYKTAVLALCVLILTCLTLKENHPPPAPIQKQVSIATETSLRQYAEAIYPPAPPITSQVMLAAKPKKRQVKPRSQRSSSVRSPIHRAKEIYRQGKEENAIAILLKTFEQDPFSSVGKQGAEMAKKLEALRLKRIELSKKKSPLQDWEAFGKREEKLLGATSIKTRMALSEAYHQKAYQAYQKKDFSTAFELWRQSIALNTGHEDARTGLKQLKLLAHKRFRQAYVLSELNPMRSQMILNDTLGFIAKESEISQKIQQAIENL